MNTEEEKPKERAIRKQFYSCPQCDEVFLDENDAIECCPVDVQWLWVCADCGENFCEKIYAENCCKDEGNK
jgi:hypothetical protein